MPSNGSPSRPLAENIVAKFKKISRWQILTGLWSEAHIRDQIEAAIEREVDRRIWRHFNRQYPTPPPKPKKGD